MRFTLRSGVYFLRSGVVNPYVWGLYKSLRSGVVSLTFRGFKSLRSGVVNPYVWGCISYVRGL